MPPLLTSITLGTLDDSGYLMVPDAVQPLVLNFTLLHRHSAEPTVWWLRKTETKNGGSKAQRRCSQECS